MHSKGVYVSLPEYRIWVAIFFWNYTKSVVRDSPLAGGNNDCPPMLSVVVGWPLETSFYLKSVMETVYVCMQSLRTHERDRDRTTTWPPTPPESRIFSASAFPLLIHLKVLMKQWTVAFGWIGSGKGEQSLWPHQAPVPVSLPPLDWSAESHPARFSRDIFRVAIKSVIAYKRSASLFVFLGPVKY